MRSIFVNLPVTDLEASKAFYVALGFTINPKFTDETAACVVIDETIYVMLLTHPKFREFITGEIADANKATGALLALSADSKDDVKATLRKALAAGARPWKPEQDYGFMYSVSFQDPDGHVWEVLWMDPVAAEEGPPEMAQAEPA